MTEFDNFNPNIKFTYEFSEEKSQCQISNSKRPTFLSVKPTDGHQYLHFELSHPKHTKSSIVYSKTLRVSRECSKDENYKNYCNQIKS